MAEPRRRSGQRHGCRVNGFTRFEDDVTPSGRTLPGLRCVGEAFGPPAFAPLQFDLRRIDGQNANLSSRFPNSKRRHNPIDLQYHSGPSNVGKAHQHHTFVNLESGFVSGRFLGWGQKKVFTIGKWVLESSFPLLFFGRGWRRLQIAKGGLRRGRGLRWKRVGDRGRDGRCHILAGNRPLARAVRTST